MKNYRLVISSGVIRFNFIDESFQVFLGSVDFVGPLALNTSRLVKHDHKIQIDWHIDFGAISGWAICQAFVGILYCVLPDLTSMACVVAYPAPLHFVFAGRAWFAAFIKVSIWGTWGGSTLNAARIVHQTRTA
jgi:hypothetical protein